MAQVYTLSTLPFPAGSRMGQAGHTMGQAGSGRQDGSAPITSIPPGSLGPSVPATAGLGQMKD